MLVPEVLQQLIHRRTIQVKFSSKVDLGSHNCRASLRNSYPPAFSKTVLIARPIGKLKAFCHTVSAQQYTLVLKLPPGALDTVLGGRESRPAKPG